MAGSTLTIEVNDEAVLAALTRLRGRLDDLAPVFADIGEYLIRSTQDRFDAEEDPEGRPWESVLVGTLAHKSHDKVLTESSRLRDSIIYQAGRNELKVGTNVIYGAIHQLGGTIKPKNTDGRLVFSFGGRTVRAKEVTIPARPYLGLSEDDQVEVLEILSEWLGEVFGPEG